LTRKSNKQANKTNEITVKEVWDVLQFAQTSMMSYFPNIYTPQLINSRMKDISFNPSVPTQDALDQALANPKNNEEILRNFVESMEILSAPFKRIISYMSSMLAYDLTYTAINVKDYNDAKYKIDLDILFDFLDRFDYKREFNNVTKQLLRNELFAFSMRDDGDKIVLQELPLNYVKITGKWDYGFLIDFDFTYFLQPGVDVRMFPPFFQKKFDEIFGGSEGYNQYLPSLPVELRSKNNYIYWVFLNQKMVLLLN